MLAETFVRAEGAFPLIGVGGIDSGATAIAKIKAGATLVQLYSGLVYRGIGLVAEIKSDLLAALQRGSRRSLAAMVGDDAADITARAAWPGNRGRRCARDGYLPRGALTSRMISQIGITITAPSRK